MQCSIESRNTWAYATKGYYDHACQRQSDKSIIERQTKKPISRTAGMQKHMLQKGQHSKLKHSHLKRDNK